jgi:hypothetical protein
VIVPQLVPQLVPRGLVPDGSALVSKTQTKITGQARYARPLPSPETGNDHEC